MNRQLLRPITNSLSLSKGCRNSSNFVTICDDSIKRRITMCNDKQRNAMGIDMIRSLQTAVDTIDLNKCRVLVLSSSGSKVFSAGHNLKELTTEKGTELHESIFKECTELCLSLKRLPIPVIAEIKGLAAAAGLQLALSCDIIVASDKASFSTPGVKFGVFCTTPGVALSRNISKKMAAKMLFTGDPIQAEDALTHGLISELVYSNEESPDQDLLQKRVDEMCETISANSRHIVGLGKNAFYKQVDQVTIESAYQIGCKVMLDNLKYEDTQSGLKAFAAKQKPAWSHSPKKIE